MSLLPFFSATKPQQILLGKEQLLNHSSISLRFIVLLLYVCIYVFNDREWTDFPKRPFWGETKIKSKSKGKYKYQVVF